MTAISVKDLLALKMAISYLGIDWWKDAMMAPRTGRGITPFYEIAQEYRIHGQELNRKAAQEWAQTIQIRYANKVFPGPLEVAKSIGAVTDSSVSFWVDPKSISAFKREFRLVPVRAGEEPLCAIAVPKSDFTSEAILSAAPDIGSLPLPGTMMSLNLFRVAWDLGYGDSRVKEAREAVMRVIFDAI
jgi:hypothetical protein